MLYDVTNEAWPFRLAVNHLGGDRYEIILVHKIENQEFTVGEIRTEFGNLLLAVKHGGGNVVINGVTFRAQIAMQIETPGGPLLADVVNETTGVAKVKKPKALAARPRMLKGKEGGE